MLKEFQYNLIILIITLTIIERIRGMFFFYKRLRYMSNDVGSWRVGRPRRPSLFHVVLVQPQVPYV